MAELFTKTEARPSGLPCQLDYGALVFVEPFQYYVAIEAAMRHQGQLAVHHWRDKVRKTRETDLWLEATARSRRPGARRASQRNSQDALARRDRGHEHSVLHIQQLQAASDGAARVPRWSIRLRNYGATIVCVM